MSDNYIILKMAVEENFNHLKQKGFSDLLDVSDTRTGIRTLCYIGKFIGLEFDLDERSEDVTCKISILKNGHIPKEYAKDEAGNRIREGISALLRRKGVREQLFTKVGNKTLAERIPITIQDFSEMIKKNPDIVRDSPDVLL